MDLQVSIHTDQPQQRDTYIHVHVEEVSHHFTQGGTQSPDVTPAVVEDPERQTHHQQQVCERYVDEKHSNRVLLGVDTEENPQSHQVPNETQDEDYGVENRQRALQGAVIHTGLWGRSEVHVAGLCEEKGAVWSLEGGRGRRGGDVFCHDVSVILSPAKWEENKVKMLHYYTAVEYSVLAGLRL